MEQTYRKAYIAVNLRVGKDGSVRPKSIVWENGKTYPIERVLTVMSCASLRVGGRGTRYTVLIGGRERCLYEEDGRWFVEASAGS